MSKLKLVFAVLAVAAAALAGWHQHQAQASLREDNDALRRQLAQLQTEKGSLADQLAEAGTFKRRATEQLNELLKLRGDVTRLQAQAGELGKLRDEIQRLRAAPGISPPLQASMDALEQQSQAALASLNRAKQGMLGFIMYADENQQQFPPPSRRPRLFSKPGWNPSK